MPNIEMYTISLCPYCSAAKALLKRKNVDFTEIDVGRDHARRAEMLTRSGGRMTVPQIFIGEQHVGGFDELRALDQAGRLDLLLAAQMTGSATFRVGLAQMRSGLSPASNGDTAIALIREAHNGGAQYVLTPENTNIMARDRDQLMAAVQEENEDSTLAGLRDIARKLRTYVHIGSLAIKVSPEKAANRSFLIDPMGEIVARYDKIHMFDVDLASGESYRESRNFNPGDRAVAVDLPWGRLGLTICYDLRFPSLYRALAEAGSSFLSVPSAFTRQTGEAHWHVLLRARAIENGCFVFAAAQAGRHENGRETYGHSLAIDPWGRILAEGGVEPGVIFAEIDPAACAAARSKIPSLQHGRRFELVEPLAEPALLHLVRENN